MKVDLVSLIGNSNDAPLPDTNIGADIFQLVTLNPALKKVFRAVEPAEPVAIPSANTPEPEVNTLNNKPTSTPKMPGM